MRAQSLPADSGCSSPTETSPLLGAQDAEDTAKNKQNGHVSNGAITRDEETPGGSIADDEREAQFKGIPEEHRNLKYIIPAVSIGVFLSAVDQTIIVASYGKIGSDLKALHLTSWIATSYFLTLTSFQPLYGRLSDIFGRKACLLFAYTVFGLGCIFCGVARDMKELIAARVFQGIGGGGMTTVVSIIMSDIIPLRDRGVWQGIINIIYASGSAIGAPLGGILADHVGWRWAFLAQGPICLAAFITVAFSLKLPSADKSNWRSKLRRIDFLGAITLVCAVFGLLLGSDRGSNVSWTMPITIISLALSVVFFIVFIAVEVWVASEPFAPGHIIFDRGLFACYACNFFSFSGWLAGLFYIPLYFQATDGVSATGAGLRLLPCIVASVTGSLASGIIMKRAGKYYWITVVAYGMLVLGLIIVFLFSGIIAKNNLAIIIGTVFSAFGNGVGVTTTLIALIAISGPKDQAVATACTYLFRTLGSVIGLSISATVIQEFLRKGLRAALHDNKDIDKIIDGVRQSLDYVKTLDPETRALVRECYGHATNAGFGALIAIVFFAFFSSFFIREKKLSR
ncbi:hypothetical protein AJ80_06142 [Polytolypa hystricis UAMH7299]|uniref:Major facilitator superfamily (MFS) profile domain-containing protein n=1 Tax=Polytolypa hystricis (strain UAMH7299) TaxID=1447883 RepID=A0A2B7XYL5_POLH7|nr:hypothetical protein AJ80_06142 [Polytolypa hystricis UAMH7299]